MHTICLFPGSFDPITKGHLKLIEKASKMFAEVHVAVLHHIGKKGCFSLEDRVFFIQKTCAHLDNVHVHVFEGLTVNLAKELNATVLLRGVRSALDFENEMTLARINKMLYNELETIFLPSDSECEVISSSAVREILTFKGDISKFVDQSILEDVNLRFHK